MESIKSNSYIIHSISYGSLFISFDKTFYEMTGFIEDYFFNLFVRVKIDLDIQSDAILKDIFDLPIALITGLKFTNH